MVIKRYIVVIITLCLLVTDQHVFDNHPCASANQDEYAENELFKGIESIGDFCNGLCCKFSTNLEVDNKQTYKGKCEGDISHIYTASTESYELLAPPNPSTWVNECVQPVAHRYKPPDYSSAQGRAPPATAAV